MHGVAPEEAEEPAFRPLKTEEFYLGRLIELCQKNGIEIHIEQTPVGQLGLERMKESGYWASYMAFLQQIADRYDVDVNMTTPSYEDSYFSDNRHLNDAGAERFTQELRERYFGNQQ